MRLARRPSVREIAKAAGVSPATVSRVLNGHPTVSPDLAARVLAAARRLGRQLAAPAAAAGAPAPRPGARIGVVFHPRLASLASDAFYGEVLTGIEAVFRAAGADLVLFTLHPNGVAAGDLNRADGLVLLGADTPEGLAQDLAARRPVVVVDRQVPGVDSVAADNASGGRMAAAYLLRQGYASLAFVCESLADANFAARCAGFRAALQAAGRDIPHLVREVGYGWQAAPQAMAEIVSTLPAPVGVVAGNDATALHCMSLARTLGKRVPEEVGFVGFDDIAVAAATVPPLTTIRVPRREMGRLAARRLLDRLREPDLPPVAMTLWVEPVERQSALGHGGEGQA